jgi:glycosyltransferase involved in cell wall biosynthesis
LRIAMVGTRGVPARYGGFETCVEEIGTRLAARGHDVVVYCRSTTQPTDRLRTYAGMRLVHLPAVRHRALETISHTGLSVAHLMTAPTDVAFLFNSANSPFLPLLRGRGVPVATHVDGLEWKRAKWTGLGKRYYRLAEQLSVRWSDALIADARGIAEYYREEFDAPTVQIAYGTREVASHAVDRIGELGLTRGGYHLVVARFEPENHVDTIVEGYVRSGARLPLVVVGSTPYSLEYDHRVRALADERVRFLGGVWDAELLDGLYAGSATYLHGHSVGGTNPSLLRAMGAGAAVLAYDVVFNREVLAGAGLYFRDAADVTALVERAEADADATRAMGRRSTDEVRRYDWDDVTDRYERLAAELPARRTRGRRRSGRRAGTGSPWA